MHKLIAFIAMLAAAFAAPAPEPGAAIFAPALTYKAPLTYYNPALLPASPALTYTYGAPISPYAGYPAYAPYAYSKFI